MLKLPLSALFLAANVGSLAQAASVTVDCGRLLDVKAGTWQERVSVNIENGLIKSITPLHAAPDHVDLSEYTCLPGLMDMHVHLTDETKTRGENAIDELRLNPADYAYGSIKFAERTLMAGFTTVRDLGAIDGLNIPMKRAIDAKEIIGPRMFTAGRIIATTGGHGDPTNGLSEKLLKGTGPLTPNEGIISGADQARDAVRARYKEGADLIKITATGGVLSQASSGQNAQFTDEELRAIIGTAKDYGFRVAAHAHGVEGIKRALRNGVDSIEHGTYMDDEAIALFKKTGAWYVPTITAGKFVAEKAAIPDYYSPLVRPKAAAVGALIQSTFNRAYKAGVKIAFGTDAAVFPHGQNAKEFGYMVEAGMPPLEAIRSATLNAAQLLNQAQRLGSVEPGYVADMVAVKGDPLKDIHLLEQIKFVMKDGTVYKKP